MGSKIHNNNIRDKALSLVFTGSITYISVKDYLLHKLSVLEQYLIIRTRISYCKILQDGLYY